MHARRWKFRLQHEFGTIPSLRNAESMRVCDSIWRTGTIATAFGTLYEALSGSLEMKIGSQRCGRSLSQLLTRLLLLRQTAADRDYSPTV